jgi:hypothetical protein
MTDGKKPGVVFWATVMAIAVLAYPLSFGPAFWLSQHSLLPDAIVSVGGVFYWPLGWVLNDDASPTWLRNGMSWYLGFWNR